MNDCVQVCVEYISVNPCKPIYLFIDRADTFVHVYIKLGHGSTIVNQLKSNSVGIIEIDYLHEYMMEGAIEVKIKEPNGLAIPIPFGDSCIAYCAVELYVSPSATNNFPNKKCATPHSCTWSLPIQKCTFSITINNCSWVVKNMNKVIYNGVEYNISASPTILVSNVVTVNPTYLAELQAISADFTASIIGNSLVVNYQGTEIVDFIEGCKTINKNCI